MQPFSRLVDFVYECTLDPVKWPSAIEAVCAELGFIHGVLGYYEWTGRPLLRMQHGMTQDWFDRMIQHAEGMGDYWGGAQKVRSFPPCEIVVHSVLQPSISEAGQRFATDWIAPQRIADLVATNLTIDETGLGSLAFASDRTLNAGFETELALLRALVPHFRRAVTISRMFEFQSVRMGEFAATLDALPIGAMLVDEHCRVHHANRAARNLMTAGIGIGVTGGRLVLADAACAAAVSRALTAAVDIAALEHHGLAIPLALDSTSGAVLHVFPLSVGDYGHHLGTRASSVVFIVESEIEPNLPIDALAIPYGLTPAEARVTELIALGATPAEAAQKLGVASSTVRSQLLQIFEKTGTSRQAELSALCRSLSMPGRR